MAVRKRKNATSDQVDAEFGGPLPSQKQPRGRVPRAVVNKPRKISPPPPATKVVSLVISVGPDDGRNMSQFLADIESALSAMRDDALLSISQASYVATPPGLSKSGFPSVSSHYRWEDWEQWKGFPDIFPPDRWEARSQERQGGPVTPPRSPREALEDLREHLGDRYPEPRVSHYDISPGEVARAPKPTGRKTVALDDIDLFEGF